MKQFVKIIGIALLLLILTACSATETATPPAAEPSTEPENTSVPSATATVIPLPTPAATLRLLEATPQEVSFEGADGTTLAGTFFPPEEADTVGVLLIHDEGGDQKEWFPLAALLQGRLISTSNNQLYATFTYDTRGNEATGGNSDPVSAQSDGEAALDIFRASPGVASNKIIIVGVGTNAGLALALCNEGCIGAIALSPTDGGPIRYLDALDQFGDDKPILCVAADADNEAPINCALRENNDTYTYHRYIADAHGMEIFSLTEQVPALTDLIFSWLADLDI